MKLSHLAHILANPAHLSLSQPLKTGNLPPHLALPIHPYSNPLMSQPEKRQALYNSMSINNDIINAKGKVIVHDVPSILRGRVFKMMLNKLRYERISRSFPNSLRWWLIAVIHEMECSQSFNKYLGNGDPLTKRTTHVPKGRPVNGTPPFSFDHAAVDALRLEGADKITDWTIGNVLYFLEGFNGYGYALYKHINSPYLWSGSNEYISGKYISDGIYDPKAVSSQIGAALLIKQLDLRGQLA